MEDNIPKYQFVLLGVDGVGKRTITRQFTQGTFDQIGPPVYQRRITVDNQECIVNVLDGVTIHDDFEKDYSFNWTTQESAGFLIVYSITDKESLVDARLRKYISYAGVISMVSENKKAMIVVGNKLDLVSARCVSVAEGEELAKSCMLTPHFVEISAKDTKSVEQLFIELVRLRRNPDHTFASGNKSDITTKKSDHKDSKNKCKLS